jgi:ubiquinone biosynthesis protein COQ9
MLFMQNSQAKILKYCSKNVAFDGWTEKLLRNACISAGLDQNYWRVIFPNGVMDAVDAYVHQANESMAHGLDLSKMRVPDKIAALIKNRLTLFENEKPAIRASLAAYALHPVRALQASYRTVDAIWRAAGDTATDWNFYSKRGLLAAVYWSTLSYWLEDSSKNHEDTWKFLAARLANVAEFGKFMGKLKKVV